MLASLRSRLIVLYLLVVTVVLGLMIHNALEMRRIEAINTRGDALRLAQLIKSEQKHALAEARQLLPLFALQLDHLNESHSDSGSDACNAYFAGLLKNNPQYANIGVIKPDGYVECSGLPLQTDTWLGDRDYFLKAMSADGFSIGDYQIGRITGKSSINFGYPLHDPNGKITGVIFAALDLDKLSQDLTGLELPKETTITLLSETGTILTRYPNEEKLIGQSALGWPIFQSIRDQEYEGTVETADPHGVDRLYAFTPIKINNSAIYVSVGIPSHVAYAAANALYLRKLLILIVTILVSAAVIWLWIGKMFLNPLDSLRRASKKMQAGDLTARTGLRASTIEVAQLADTFDQMAETIENRYKEKIAHENELQNLNRALRTLSGGNHVLIRATQESALLQEMCRVAVEKGDYLAAWVGYADHDKEKSIIPMASVGIDKTLLSTIQLTWSDTSEEDFICGDAIRSGKTCFANEVSKNKDSLFKKYLPTLDIKAALALPLIIDGNVLGAFSIYTDKSDAFSEDECVILQEMAEDLAYGIKTLRLRQEHENAVETINKMAFYDSLTQLPNHIRFEELLRESLSVENAEQNKAALVIIGLDRFKDINNTLGFEAGDRVLSETGKRIKRCLINDETLARMRGDEFAVFIPGADEEKASNRASQILKKLEPLYDLDGFSLNVHASLGIVLFPEHDRQPQKLLAYADVALQHAKQTGNGYEFYSREKDSDKKHLLALAGKLHRAIENDQLDLYYQPKISMATGRVSGFEALARWFPGNEETIPPNVFIGLAEKTGMIRAISNWVIESAMRQSSLWQQSGIVLPIAINLSARNIHDPHLLEYIEDRLNAWKLERGLLEVEITETAIMEDTETAVQVLTRMRDFGIPVYIDDFGTGQSSLIALKKQPVSALKIDKSFVIEMLEDRDAAAIVRTTINLAHELELSVVAEGIESEAIWQALTELKCHYGQGYYMGKPMPVEDITTWLETSNFGLKNDSR